MVIVTVQFEYDNNKRYERLLNTFCKSINKNNPDVKIEKILIKAPKPRDSENKFLISNTKKLECWYNYLKTTTEEKIIFADCDMLNLKKIECDLDFDIGITKRDNCVLPYNGGIVFVKNNDNGKKFIELWNYVNNKMYYEWRDIHAQYRLKYGGMNQAALGYLLEKMDHGAKIKFLPCLTYNACDDNWKFINPKTIFVHIKGKLRRAVLSKARHVNCQPAIYEIMKLWKEYERID